MLQIKIPSIFKNLFLGLYSTYRILVYYGGRGGGKSYAISLFLVLECLKNPITVWAAREIDKSKKVSVLEQFIQTIKNLDIMDYVNITQSNITFNNGAKIIFEGVSDITINNLKSVVGVKYFWFEEAQGLSQNLISVLIPSIRAENSQIIISLNPQKSTDYIYKEFILAKENNYSKAIKVNYYDNPFFPEVLNKDRLQNLQSMSKDLYLHIWEGETNDYNDKLVIDINKISYYDDSINIDYQQILLSLDTAYSVKTSADYSAICVLGLCENDDIHLIHVNRGQWDFFTLKDRVKGIYMTIASKYKTRISLLIENKASGQSLIQELQRETNLPVISTTPIVDKFNRVVNDFLPYIDRLKLPVTKNTYNNWVNDYLVECKNFRSDGKHDNDDMIDATSQALKYLNRHNLNYDKIKTVFNNYKQDF